MPDKNLEEIKRDLHGAFDRMIENIQAARDAIDDPSLFAPPASERTLAEGYRYVLGFLHGSIERALSDPLYPQFYRAIQPINRSTIDNSDAVYLCAEIDGNYSYRLKGKALNCDHWRGGEAVAGPRAPQYVIFELSSAYAGDSGGLKEMMPGSRINTSTLDCQQLEVAEDGSFEILIAPQRPQGHVGNFMLSRRESRGTEFIGRYLTCRQLFHDWANEDLLELEILRIGCEHEPRAPLDAAGAISLMDRIGELTRNQVHFWNAFYTITLETYGKQPGTQSAAGNSDRQFMPVNDMNPPNALGLATGGGQSSNIYSGGVFQLAEDEALLIECQLQETPQFMGFHLSNLWGESLDFANYQSNLNGHMLEPDDAGTYRWVVSHRDPGVANWVDTTGLDHGYLTIRWTYSNQPDHGNWPSLNVRKLAFEDVRDAFPAGSRIVSPQDRADNILMRQRHVQRRYRQY